MDYLYIRVWHMQTGAFAYYIENLVEQARRDKAPQNAIYFSKENGWVTADTIRSEEVRAEIERDVERLRKLHT